MASQILIFKYTLYGESKTTFGPMHELFTQMLEGVEATDDQHGSASHAMMIANAVELAIGKCESLQRAAEAQQTALARHRNDCKNKKRKGARCKRCLGHLQDKIRPENYWTPTEIVTEFLDEVELAFDEVLREDDKEESRRLRTIALGDQIEGIQAFVASLLGQVA